MTGNNKYINFNLYKENVLCILHEFVASFYNHHFSS